MCKAFNQVELNKIDQNKLLFLWFEEVSKNNLKITVNKNVGLPFGFRCSPTLLGF